MSSGLATAPAADPRFVDGCGLRLVHARRRAVAQPGQDPAPHHCGGAAHLRRGDADPAEVSRRIAGAGGRPRQCVPAPRRRSRHQRPQRGRSGSGDQPGPDHSVARSRRRSDQQAQTRRASRIRSGAWRRVAVQVAARLHRAHQEPDEHDAGRARAQRLLRPAQRLPGGEVARHRHRLPVGKSRARRARRQRHRRRLSATPAARQAGAGARRRAVALRRDREAAQEGRGVRGQGRVVPRPRQSPGRPQRQHACRRSSLAI